MGRWCGGAVLCLIGATLYRRYRDMVWWGCIMSYRCHTVQEIWGDGVVGLYLGDNDRAARVLFVQHPREQGE